MYAFLPFQPDVHLAWVWKEFFSSLLLLSLHNDHSDKQEINKKGWP